eukprot:GILK01016873.1.p1 GENE.GILK01016873.1~~GILK01016873.1.p1  ORF type:complete len:205 (+),score=15.84 GILK01016873.1:141-755(+)
MATITVTQLEDYSLPKHKVVVLGDAAVGKTSLIFRFLLGEYEDERRPTIGLDFMSKVVEVDPKRSVRLELWDTAGQERFRSLIPSYLRDASIALVVFDITSRASFEHAFRWVEDVQTARGDDTSIFLVANKIDFNSRRQVSDEEVTTKAHDVGVTYVEVSAKSGAGVAQLFQRVAQCTIVEKPQIGDTSIVILSNDKRKKGRCC